MRLGRHSMDSSARLLVVLISVGGLPCTAYECSRLRRKYAAKNNAHQDMIEKLATIANTRGINEVRPAESPITIGPTRNAVIKARTAGAAEPQPTDFSYAFPWPPPHSVRQQRSHTDRKSVV